MGSSSIGKIEEIPLDKLELGTAQVRTDLSSGIDDLAASIRKQGLIHPIYVSQLPSFCREIHKLLHLKQLKDFA